MKLYKLGLFIALSVGCAPGPMGPQGLPGIKGDKGDAGAPGTMTLPIPLCPTTPESSGHIEYILLIDERPFALYYTGKQAFLTELKKNVTYQTTDGRDCKFYIADDNSVVYLP